MARKTNTTKALCDMANATGGSAGLTVREFWSKMGREDIVDGLKAHEAKVNAATGTTMGGDAQMRAKRALGALQMALGGNY